MPAISFFRVGDNVELWRVCVFLCVLIAFVMLLEQMMHKAEHALVKYPKYHEMLSKIYRELMILGLIGLGVKMIKELAIADGYGKNMIAFQAGDLVVFLTAVALIIQAICVFSLLRRRNMRMDRDELVSTADLVDLVRNHQNMLRAQSWLRRMWPWSKAPPTQVGIAGNTMAFSAARYDEMVSYRTLRHFFLRTYGLPELFPFSKYLRQAQDHQITHMIDVEMSMWMLLIFFTWALDYSTVFLEKYNHEVERHALVSMFLIFSWSLTVLHAAVARYLQSALKKILSAAGFSSHADMVPCLRNVAAEEARHLATEMADNAMEIMQHVQEEQEALQVDHHGGGGHGHEGGHGHQDSGFQLLKGCFQRIFGCKKKAHGHHGDDGHSKAHVRRHVSTVPKVKIRFFSREGIHFLVKFLIMLNGFYIALMVQAVLYELPEIYERFGIFPTLMIPTPMLINMFLFQPQICRNFIFVSSVFQVDVPTLSEVITHFSESVELRSDFVSCIMQGMRENGQTVEEMHAEFLAKDPAKTGLIELEELRQVLRVFGCQVSFFRFNGVAKLLFRLKGTQVEYAQVERLLTLAEQEDMRSMSHAPGRRTTNAPKYLHTIMAEEAEVQCRDTVARASQLSRPSMDAFFVNSADFTRKPTPPHGQTRSNNRFGLPRFSAHHPNLPAMPEVDSNGSGRTPAERGGPRSNRSRHSYHPA